ARYAEAPSIETERRAVGRSSTPCQGARVEGLLPGEHRLVVAHRSAHDCVSPGRGIGARPHRSECDGAAAEGEPRGSFHRTHRTRSKPRRSSRVTEPSLNSM